MAPVPTPPRSTTALAAGLALASFGAAAGAYALFDAVRLAAALFFPIRLHVWLVGLLREPGIQDVQYGACRLPACDRVSLLLTIVVSGAAFYLAAVAIDRLRAGR